jgi:hypothetical protein
MTGRQSLFGQDLAQAHSLMQWERVTRCKNTGHVVINRGEQ